MTSALSTPSPVSRPAPADPAASLRPRMVTVAFALVWTQVVVGLISATVFILDRSTGNGDSILVLLIGETVSVGLPAIASVPMARRKRWGQVVVFALAVLGLVLRSVGLGDDPFVPLGLFQTASIACNLGIIAALATPSARAFFTKKP